jgi:hypothetical protein
MDSAAQWVYAGPEREQENPPRVCALTGYLFRVPSALDAFTLAAFLRYRHPKEHRSEQSQSTNQPNLGTRPAIAAGTGVRGISNFLERLHSRRV